MIPLMRVKRIFATVAWCALACLVGVACAADVPMLSGRIVDNAELLSSGARERIGAALKTHEDKTGNQIAVLTIPTLGDDHIEQYAVRVFESWKLGKKGKDNGVLLVIVPKERKIRIEVGYGLEGALPDVAASRVIRNVIAPQFKANNFDQGVEEGVAALVNQLEGNAGDGPQETKEKDTPFGIQEPHLPLGERILFGAFIFGIIGLFTIVGIFTPGMGWFLYLFLIPFWALFPIVVVGVKGALAVLGVYLAGFPAAKLLLPRTQWYKNRTRTSLADRRQRGRSRFGGVNHSRDSWSSSSGSWGSSSSDSSSGGFSGGGGDSGGGGSSGDY